MKRFLYFLVLSFLLSVGSAQTYVELILDASGSMWNKLDDDRYRIVAAKDVLTQFIGGLPDGDLNVGLRVYGSQIAALDEGSCEDTQLFVPMNGVDKAALSQTVQNTTALGATPIAKSLLAAADDFPTDAQKRLIILVTDGEESCGGDLQAVAEELRARGFDIDIRIIGFDLDQKAIDSFEGVGTFENAESAEELAQALDTAVEDVVVVEEENDCSQPAAINSPLEVEASYPFALTLQGPDGFVSLHPLGGDDFSAIDSVVPKEGNAELTAPSEANTYELRYTASRGNCVIASSQIAVVATQVSLDAPAEVETSYIFNVGFEGPEGYIGIYTTDAEGRHDTNSSAFTGWDNPAELLAPAVAGNYEIRYYDSNGDLLGTTAIVVVQGQATLSPPESVEASFNFNVPFSGPIGHIGIYTLDAEGRTNDISAHYSEWGNPAELLAPAIAGTYEIRYYDADNNLIQTAPIEVTEGQATLSPPESVEASFNFNVPFSGPIGHIGIYTLDAEGRTNDISAHYSEWGNPAELLAPAIAGTYEIRYYDADNNLIQTAPIEVTEGQATLSPPESVEASFNFNVPFSGPIGHIGIYTLDAEGRTNDISAHYSEWGNPAELLAPAIAGTYEIRYYDADNNLIQTAPITITASQASMSPPTSIEAGSSFKVPFSGPIGWVGVYEQSASGRNDDFSAAYSEWGNPAEIGVPVETGTYEVRYYDNDNNLLLTSPITVTPTTASLDVPTNIAAGSDFSVPYAGPLGWIGIYEINAAGRNDDISAHFSEWGNPAELTAPETAGSYELRYYAQPENGEIGLLLSIPISVQ